MRQFEHETKLSDEVMKLCRSKGMTDTEIALMLLDAWDDQGPRAQGRARIFIDKWIKENV